MSLNPLNELKRRLDDEGSPLPKRLCLAKNVVQSHHFPSVPKERIVGDWLATLMQKNKLSGDDLRSLLQWLDYTNDLTGELKGRFIQIVAEYIQNNQLQENDMQCILSFIENDKMMAQLLLYTNDYLIITVTLLQYLKINGNVTDVSLTCKILNNIVTYYKTSKKKLDFIVKFLAGENLETIFSFLDTECRDTAVEVCKTILFSFNKKSFFINFLQTLIRKDNIDELIAEKGDNIQAVIKIMNSFFNFPEGRTSKDQNFLSNYIDVFVNCFRNENQLIFAFYIMVVNTLKMDQNYMLPTINLSTITFDQNDEKIKRSLFLKMLDILLSNEVDINVRLTDTFGEKISKVETKKNFTAFLQAVMMGQLKLEGKPDKYTMLIVKTALKLDPILIEQKMDQILPPIMIGKKSNASVMESYKEMLNCLLEILFKLSKGTQIFNQLLPHLKVSLEACNTDQVQLREKLQECEANGIIDCDKIVSKIVTINDVFPEECVELYGKWTSELMFRQSSELMASLRNCFEDYCLVMLEEPVTPSTIILTELMSAILCSYFEHNKMADHTVPRQIAENFWDIYKTFEAKCLKKMGKCVLKQNNFSLVLSFIKLCLSYSHLKLLNFNYSFIEFDMSSKIDESDVFDLSVLLPCLNSEQWTKLASKITEDEALLILNKLLIAKTAALELLSIDKTENNKKEQIITTKLFLIKQLASKSEILNSNKYFPKILFHNLETAQAKQLAKCLVKLYSDNLNTDILNTVSVTNNRLLLNALVLETTKHIMQSFENSDTICKSFKKMDFNFADFAKEINLTDFFNHLSIKEDISEDVIVNYLEILEHLKIYYLDETYQLVVIFVLLGVKKCCQSKKIRRTVDNLLQSIFELSPKYPDIFKIFPVDFIFSFKENSLLNLLQLKIKTSNHMLVIKTVLECAVKKVKTENEIVKNIVKILLSKKSRKNKVSSIEYFSDEVFQISCIILPIIAKEKKAITSSMYRSILADLQEKLHNTMLDSFKSIDFSNNRSLFLDDTGNIDDSTVISENALATLNAIEAYSLTLSKYCETTNSDEIRNLECLWSGLEFFISNAINTISGKESKNQHIQSSIQLLNVLLRHIKKLDTHEIFQKRDELFLKIWRSIITRLQMVLDQRNKTKKRRINDRCIEDVAVTLKFLCELSSVECFINHFVGDLNELVILKDLKLFLKDDESIHSVLTSHKVSHYLWTNCLKANIVGPKCVAMSKLMFTTCRKMQNWIQQQYEYSQNGINCCENKDKNDYLDDRKVNTNIVQIEDSVVELIKINMNTLSEVILSAKKISLDYKFLDSIFELQHMVYYILGCNAQHIKCEVTWQGFFTLYEASLNVLNSLLRSREEILEDRWPCYLQCYRALISSLCERSTTQLQLERPIQEKLAEIAHSVEKLTQSLCKKKTHISRLAAYTVGDICFNLESAAPPKMVRQHLENSVAFLIQASDSTYAMAFLKRALAGSVGQSTMSNLYSMYKRYHKYVGNA